MPDNDITPDTSVADAAEIIENDSQENSSSFLKLLEEVRKTSDDSNSDSTDSGNESNDDSEDDDLSDDDDNTKEESDENEESNEDEDEEEASDTDKADLKFLRDNRDRMIQLLELERKLMDKDGFTDVLQALVKGVAKMHNVDVGKLFEFKNDDFDTNDDDDEGDFETQYERDIYEKAKRAALKQFKSELNPLQEKLNRLEQAEQDRSAKQNLSNAVEQNYDKWSKRLEKEVGFKPSRAQVKRAIEEHPKLEPLKAIKVEYMDDILKIKAKEAARSAPKADTMVSRSVSSGKPSGTGPKSFAELLAETREERSRGR